MTRSGNWDLDFEGDFRVVDGWELVTLRRQNADATYTDAGPIFAARESVNKKTVAGQMEAADCVFHLDAQAGDAPDGTPTVGVGDDGVSTGDRIRDAVGREYEVKGPTLEGAEDQWRCPVTKVP